MSRDERIAAFYRSVIKVNGVSSEGVPFEAHEAVLSAFYDHSTPYEVKLKGGRYLFLEIVRASGGDANIVLTDTTAATFTQEERLASIHDAFDGIGEALVLYDKDGRCIFSKASYRNPYGLALNPPKVGETFDSALQRLIDRDFYDRPPDPSKDAFFKAGVEAFYNRSANGDFPITAADGRMLIASSFKGSASV